MKIVFLSNRHVDQRLFWRNVMPPLERAFSEEEGVRVIAPPGFRPATFRSDRPAWLDALRAVRDADAVFWIQLNLRPPLPIWGLVYVRPLAERHMLVVDAWRSRLDDLARAVKKQHLSSCYVVFTEALDILQSRHPDLPFRWLPAGYNSDLFHDAGRKRDIDVFWLGRRYEPLHEAIRAFCDRRGLVYRYSGNGVDPKTKEELSDIIERSRYYVTTTPDLEDPVRTGGFRPLTSRYLEGPAAGTRIIGVAPVERELDFFLPAGSLVECLPDGSDFEEVFDAAEADPDWEQRRVAARDVASSRHRWSDRAVEVVRQIRGAS